jgi:uncharacterized protein
MSTLKFNVAQLLRQEVGARRVHDFVERVLPVDADLTLSNILGYVCFTRTTSGVMAHVQAHGIVCLTCVRSLEEFDQPVEFDFKDEFHAVLDVINGHPLAKPFDDDPYFLNELHMADIGDALREYTLLQLPLNPVCQAYRDHPIHYSVASDGYDDEQANILDKRLEVLKTWTVFDSTETEIADYHS